eukprot:5911144-Prymnesium_polylepis.5
MSGLRERSHSPRRVQSNASLVVVLGAVDQVAASPRRRLVVAEPSDSIGVSDGVLRRHRTARRVPAHRERTRHVATKRHGPMETPSRVRHFYRVADLGDALLGR